MLELLRYDALMAAAALCTCILLVLTKSWHGSFSIDSTDGIQKFHTQPTHPPHRRHRHRRRGSGRLCCLPATTLPQRKNAPSSALSCLQACPLIFGLLEDHQTRLGACASAGHHGLGILGLGPDLVRMHDDLVHELHGQLPTLGNVCLSAWATSRLSSATPSRSAKASPRSSPSSNSCSGSSTSSSSWKAERRTCGASCHPPGPTWAKGLHRQESSNFLGQPTRNS